MEKGLLLTTGKKKKALERKSPQLNKKKGKDHINPAGGKGQTLTVSGRNFRRTKKKKLTLRLRKGNRENVTSRH